MKQQSASATAPLQWSKTINAGYYINSAAISGDGAVVVAVTFFHSYGDDARKLGTLTNNGTFGTYCFDRDGNQLWVYETDNMSWAMQISADATGIVAGSDTGSIYYFTPQ